MCHADVTLVDNGSSKAAIFVSQRVMAPDKKAPLKRYAGIEEDDVQQQQRLRESTRDLSRCLEKITGAPIEIVEGVPQEGDKRLPIYIGELAEKVFGPAGKKAPFRQGFRYVVSPRGVGLYGESDLASSYAVYELLDRLGCRWYMPSDLGEVIPFMKSIVLKETDFSSAPATIYRGIWFADESYDRRNRLGGFPVQTRHALERYLTKEDRDKHPDWRAEIGGQPSAKRLKWSSEGVAAAIADKIDANLDAKPQLSVSLSPNDGGDFDESAEDRKLDAGDFDPSTGTVSVTDRLLVLCKRIAAQVLKKHPDTVFGMLAYSTYTRPPVRETVPTYIVPQIAPITSERAHPMTDEHAPGSKDFRYLVEGWTKVAPQLSYYLYAWFLADSAVPYPLIKKYSIDLPILFKNHCIFWQPETKATFESNMQGLYLGDRLAWDPAQDPAGIIHELNQLFYGNAGREMEAYWSFIDDAWVNTPEYTGACFGYLQRFTPEVMTKARALMDAGVAACKTPMESRRVEMANRSLQQFELFMKMRRDFDAGRFADIGKDSGQWLATEASLAQEYKDQFAFGLLNSSKAAPVYGVMCFNWSCGKTYADADRIAKECQIATPKPLKFKYNVDKEGKGEELGWGKAEFDDSSWKETDPGSETWSTLGLYNYFGVAWYRTAFEMPSIPIGRKAFLWLGATDGSAEVFVNGKPVPYTNPKTNIAEVFTGYCEPVSFDITDMVRPGSKIQVSIRCKRTQANELGTGGLLGPVMVYFGKDSVAAR